MLRSICSYDKNMQFFMKVTTFTDLIHRTLTVHAFAVSSYSQILNCIHFRLVRYAKIHPQIYFHAVFTFRPGNILAFSEDFITGVFSAGDKL